MMPSDTFRVERTGIVALVAAVVAAAGLCWYAWSDAPEVEAKLVAAQLAAEKIRGKEPLRARVDRQREANRHLRDDIAVLKKGAGFQITQQFAIPPEHRQPGQFFKDRYIEVRESLRVKADARNIERDESLGFPDADRRIPDDSEAPQLLAMLQLTEKAMNIVLDAPDPVERYSISHGTPIETGPVNRPALLKEYPLHLEVRGSLKTILTILHRLGQVEDNGRDYPLILRGLSIRSNNTKIKDEVQQLEATLEIAGMQFISDEKRGEIAVRGGEAAVSKPGAARP